MRKVLLVDDEPFILQGLKIIIDWEAEGYEVVAMCANGQEAYDYLCHNEVDLIVADIQMPIMTGLELLERIRNEEISQAFFVILTGFKEFSFIQKALRYDCMDYLLKPVEKQELLRVIGRISLAVDERNEAEKTRDDMEQAYMARNLMALLFGKYDDKNIDYVSSHMQLSGIIRYVDIEIADHADESEELEEGEMREFQRKMFSACRDYLKDEKNHCIFDVSRDEKSYDIGLIYCDFFAKKRNVSMEEFFENLQRHIKMETGFNTNVFVGKPVNKLEAVSKSYSSACVMKSLEAFRAKKQIYYYDEEVASEENNIIILKDILDELVAGIEADNEGEISDCVDKLFEEMNNKMTEETKRLNVNYLLFRLIHKATELDSEINQEEILRFIAEHSFEEGILRGSNVHISKFCTEYAEYLQQLRKNVSGGILQEIEKEISVHYMDNLSLRDLGKKYYINSSYLGQMFQKKYNQSFRDYLTKYRIECAKQMLVNSDKRISDIAEEVGYKDTDYFLKKFIEANGCTPSKYRKNNRG